MKKRERSEKPAPCHCSCTVTMETYEQLNEHIDRKNMRGESSAHWTRARLLRYIITKWCKDNKYKLIHNMPQKLRREMNDDDD